MTRIKSSGLFGVYMERIHCRRDRQKYAMKVHFPRPPGYIVLLWKGAHE